MRDLAGIAEINGPRRAELQAERAANVAAQARAPLQEPAWFYRPAFTQAHADSVRAAANGIYRMSPEPAGRDC